MNLDKETQGKIQEMQILEQNLHSLLMQKQAFQMELNETENAILEAAKSSDDIFKIVGKIMIKVDKDKIEKELKHKKEIMSLRLKSIEKHEEALAKQLEELREEVMKKLK
jgi:prefoldin beta subunit